MSSSDSSKSALLYTKKQTTVFDEVWDDTELIKMYERSTAKAYAKLQNEFCGKSNTSKTSEPKIKWKVGDSCMAPYAEDGKWYPAKIESINNSKKTCQIIFDGYDASATVKLDSLMTEDDVELVSDEAEKEENTDHINKKECEGKSINNVESQSAAKNKEKAKIDEPNIGNVFPLPDLCPPPPNYLIDKVTNAGTDREALTNALMSWYMAGYHTGYYQGLIAQRTDKSKNPRSVTTKKNGKA